jgi:putative ABC transport system permease protein
MNLFSLSWKYIRAKPLANLLNVILVALGVALTSVLLLINSQFEERLYRNIEPIHLVVGAKGSPLQMILSSVYHIDIPTGNIPLSESYLVTKNPYVEKAIPLALGDSYKTYRIVGTTTDYIDLYKAEIKEGQLFKADLEVVVGSRIAAKLNMKLGDKFNGAHGLVADDKMHAHKEHSYTVVGILKPSGTVLDALILTNVSSVWLVHEEHDHDHEEEGDDHAGHDHGADEHNHDDHAGHDHDAHAGHDHGTADTAAHVHDETCNHAHDEPAADSTAAMNLEGKEVTAYLLVYKKDKTGNVSAMADQMVPRIIGDNSEKMGVARPAWELQRLLDLTGMGSQFLKILAYVIIFISAMSMFISLYNSLKERRYELAVMRVMGASRGRLFSLILLEGFWVAILGLIIGFAFSHVGMSILSVYLEKAYQYEFSGAVFLASEAFLTLVILLVGFLSALIPALQAYNTDISNTLADS